MPNIYLLLTISVSPYVWSLMHHLTSFHRGEINFWENKWQQLSAGETKSYLVQVYCIYLHELQMHLQYKCFSLCNTDDKEIVYSLVFLGGTSEKWTSHLQGSLSDLQPNDKGPGMITDDISYFQLMLSRQHILWVFITFWTTVWDERILRLLKFMTAKHSYRVKVNFKHNV